MQVFFSDAEGGPHNHIWLVWRCKHREVYSKKVSRALKQFIKVNKYTFFFAEYRPLSKMEPHNAGLDTVL